MSTELLINKAQQSRLVLAQHTDFYKHRLEEMFGPFFRGQLEYLTETSNMHAFWFDCTASNDAR